MMKCRKIPYTESNSQFLHDFVMAVGLFIHSFITFDHILKRQHSELHEIWKDDGKAIGFFWVPKEARVVGESMVRSGRFFEWVFHRRIGKRGMISMLF